MPNTALQDLPADRRPFPNPSPRRWPGVLLLSLGLGLAAASLAARASHPRPALTPDSIAYLNAAGNLSRGNGLVLTLTPLSTPDLVLPFASWPPLHPVLVAGVQALVGDPIAAARWVQLVAVALLALPLGLLAYRVAGRSFVLPVLAFFAVLRPQLVVSSFVWTESLFLLWIYSCLALLLEGLREERYQDRRRMPLLFTAGTLAGLAMLTRYLGVVVIAAGAITIVLHESEEPSARRTIRKIGSFVTPAILPNLAWLIRNRLETGFLFGENRGAAALEPEGIVLAAMRTLCVDTLAPPIFESGAARLVLTAVGILAFTILTATAMKRFGPETYEGRIDRHRAVNTLSTFGLLYILLTLGLALRVQYDPINTRLLAPIYPAMLLLGGFLLRPVFAPGPTRGSRRLRRTVLLAAGILLTIQAAAAYRYLAAPREDRSLTSPYWRSDLFADPGWRDDPAVQRLLELTRPGTLVLTNIPDVVALWTDRPTKPLPERTQDDFAEQVARHRNAVVFVHPRHRRVLGGVEEIDRMVRDGRCTPLGRAGEGVFYRVRG